jgi:hypothetical protein
MDALPIVDESPLNWAAPGENSTTFIARLRHKNRQNNFFLP